MLFWYQEIRGEFVGLLLELIDFDVFDVIEKSRCETCSVMQDDVGNFVHQREPEVVQGIAPQCQADNWNVFHEEGCTIDFHSRNVSLDDEYDAMFSQQRLRLQWAIGLGAELGQLL